jgi:membrane protein implicated in regulation of membrane protease activity
MLLFFCAFLFVLSYLNKYKQMEQYALYLAVPATVIYVLMIISSFMGMDSMDGVEADFDGDLELEDGESASFHFFTLKNAIGFLLGLSWGTLIGIRDLDFTNLHSLLFGVSLGILMVILQSALFFFMSKLQEKNEPSISSAEGQIGTVYLTIPPSRSGRGKITVTVSGSRKVLDAVTDHSDELKTNTSVKVVSIEGDQVKVEPSNS